MTSWAARAPATLKTMNVTPATARREKISNLCRVIVNVILHWIGGWRTIWVDSIVEYINKREYVDGTGAYRNFFAAGGGRAV
jgi:hypothetical protein